MEIWLEALILYGIGLLGGFVMGLYLGVLLSKKRIGKKDET